MSYLKPEQVFFFSLLFEHVHCIYRIFSKKSFEKNFRILSDLKLKTKGYCLYTSSFWILICLLHVCYRFMSVLILYYVCCIRLQILVVVFFLFKILLAFTFVLYQFTCFITFINLFSVITIL